MAVPTPFHNPRIPLSALTAATSFQNPPVLVLLPISIPAETVPDVELFMELNKSPTPILEDSRRAIPGPCRRTNTPAPAPPLPPPLPAGIPDGMDGMGSPHIPAHLEGFKHPLGGLSLAL